MDLSIISTAIATIGFPIVACLFMGYYMKMIIDRQFEQIDKITSQHNKEIKTITDALNNNTLAIQHLSDMMNKESDE